MNPETIEVKISDIIIEDRFRKDFGNEKQTADSIEQHGKTLEELAQSIEETGLLQPIGITEDNKLVFGERRLLACRDILGWQTIPARIVPVDSILLGQIAENTFRKNYTISERVAIVDALKGYKHGGDRKSDQGSSGDLDSCLTVDQAAKKVGFGKASYYRAKDIIDEGSEELIKAVDESFISVTAAKFLVNKADKDEQARIVEGKTKLTELSAKKELRQLRALNPASTLDKTKQLLEEGKEDPDLGLVYTPPAVAEFIFNTLRNLNPQTVLDVASGNGALSKPWKEVATVEEYEIGYGNDFFKSPEQIDADLVVCNPPFCREEEFLKRIVDVVPVNTPIVLKITSYTFRMGAYGGSKRWKWLRDECPEITSTITLPKDIFKGARHAIEVLVFRGESLGLKPHYVLGEPAANNETCDDATSTISVVSPPAKLTTIPMLEPCSVTEGDCRELIWALPDQSIDLCVTSPPYAEQRKEFYRSVPEDKYTEFTLEWMTALKSKLTENGSVLINIDAHVKDGVVSDYVLKMQLALREAGWNPHRTQIWHKGGMPAGRPDWPRHSYEEVLWLSRSKNPFCDTRAAGTATGNALVTDRARVSDVIRIDVANNENGVDHPARFPVRLAEHLIKTFCPKGGTVLDPFSGSGSSLLAAEKLQCDYYGFEIMQKYVELSRERLKDLKNTLPIAPVAFVDAVDEGLSQSRSCETDAA